MLQGCAISLERQIVPILRPPGRYLQGVFNMTEKELKKLNRYQLLELIILQTEQINDLELQLSKTRKALESQQIRISQAGSIAEAALQLSGVFEAAQAAADTYLENVKIHTENADLIEAEAQRNADQCIAQAEQKAAQILQDAQKQSESILKTAWKQADETILSAQTMLQETTRRCTEKENAVNAYITNIKEAFHLQFQNLDQITQDRKDNP